jgi:hypothetical protein
MGVGSDFTVFFLTLLAKKGNKKDGRKRAKKEENCF